MIVLKEENNNNDRQIYRHTDQQTMLLLLGIIVLLNSTQRVVTDAGVNTSLSVVLLWWREFEARSVAVFLLTCHRGGGGRCQSQGC